MTSRQPGMGWDGDAAGLLPSMLAELPCSAGEGAAVCAVVGMWGPAPEKAQELNFMSSKSSRFSQNAQVPRSHSSLKSRIHGYQAWDPALLGSQFLGILTSGMGVCH